MGNSMQSCYDMLDDLYEELENENLTEEERKKIQKKIDSFRYGIG